MKTTGQILAEKRIAKNIAIAEVSRATKIRPEFIQYIEADDYAKLPNSTVTKGFIRNYSEFLDLKPEQVIAVFRRDFVEDIKGQIVPRGIATPLNSKFVWTPKMTLSVTLGLILLLFGGYLYYQYRLLSGPPLLILKEPLDGVVTTENIITISGRTNPEATVAINDQKVTLTGAGNFVFRWELPQKGKQQVTVVAISKSGQTTSVTRTVDYQ